MFNRNPKTMTLSEFERNLLKLCLNDSIDRLTTQLETTTEQNLRDTLTSAILRRSDLVERMNKGE